MISTTDQLQQIILPILKKYRAESALLFGSYARQEATQSSDIDLLVIGGTEFDPTDVFCIADELRRATGKAVDLSFRTTHHADASYGRKTHSMDNYNTAL